MHGPVDPAVPPTIDLSMTMEYQPYNLPGAGFLGMAHTSFKPSGERILKPKTLADVVNSTSLQQLQARLLAGEQSVGAFRP